MKIFIKLFATMFWLQILTLGQGNRISANFGYVINGKTANTTALLQPRFMRFYLVNTTSVKPLKDNK